MKPIFKFLIIYALVSFGVGFIFGFIEVFSTGIYSFYQSGLNPRTAFANSYPLIAWLFRLIESFVPPIIAFLLSCPKKQTAQTEDKR